MLEQEKCHPFLPPLAFLDFFHALSFLCLLLEAVGGVRGWSRVQADPELLLHVKVQPREAYSVGYGGPGFDPRPLGRERPPRRRPRGGLLGLPPGPASWACLPVCHPVRTWCVNIWQFFLPAHIET